MFGTRLVLTVAALSVTLLVVGSVAQADPDGGPRCTLGEAMANFQSPFEHLVSDDIGVRFRCQYRLFMDGTDRTYCEDDVILGGSIAYVEYKALGWSREEGIAYIQLFGDRLWIDGVERPLISTGYRDGQHPRDGHSVYQQVGFITQLPVGDHVSYWEGTFDGLPDGSATVNLHILPRTDPLCS